MSAGTISTAAGSNTNPASIQAQLRSEWFQALDRQEGITLCTQMVSEILQKSQDVIFQKHIDRQVLPYAIQFARETMLRAIEWEFFKMDPGEADLSTWEPDPEPHPVRIDSWARGALPIVEMAGKNLVPALALTPDSMIFLGKSKTDLTSKRTSRSFTALDKTQPPPLPSPRPSFGNKPKASPVAPAREPPEKTPSKPIATRRLPPPPVSTLIKPTKKIAVTATKRTQRPPEAA
ncbi:hypothetical protein SeMB42_g05479 [Synchytrium endobioticum]|uniref:Uncharacterized protein n=1 Tax=Synchytrium endobioticum TaxID=286115 RepID=A0A507CR84_9FUNG|nr:hypothetical protein SeMB42_g05479 [Synchytrium endobioticum]TPX49317.1 hypothetical protein SeLEV6574_g01545 [Synchytrium endobioticum]